MPPTPIKTPNGERARELRTGKRLSVRAAADLVNRHESTVRQVEKNKPTSVTVLGQLAEAYGVELSELLAADQPQAS